MVLAFLLVGCATAGETDKTSVDARPLVDAPDFTVDAPLPPVDAPVSIDAPLFTDAPITADAPGGGLFCATSSDCTLAGECCLLQICVPGTEIAGVCLPF